MEVLDIKKLSVTTKEHEILKVESFKLHKGHICYVDGRSGSGKSVFFKSLIRLLPMTYKKFSLNGYNIDTIKPHELRLKVMYSNQHPQFPIGKVSNFLKLIFGFEHHKKFSGKFVRSFHTYLEQLSNNNDILDRDTTNLSGGEIQILQLSLALAFCQGILILDEAFSAMDHVTHHKAEKIVLDWLNEKDNPRSIIFTTHQPELSLLKPNETYGMNSGYLIKNN